MDKDSADVIIHELTVEITGYQTEIEMIEFLAEQRKEFKKKSKLTKEEKRRIESAQMRLKRLEFCVRILNESFYPQGFGDVELDPISGLPEHLFRNDDDDPIENLYSDSDDPTEI